MIIDLIFAVLLCIAVFKGYQKGFVVGIFSYLAFVIGLAAAMKLSAVVATRVGSIIKVSDKWLPFMAFVAVLIGVIIIVKWAARLIQLSMEKVLLGWLNRLGGILFFVMLYCAAYSILLFYVNQLHLLPDTTIAKSTMFPFIDAFGKRAIGIIGSIIPAFKDLFLQLEHFFEKAAT
ncbi:MAG: CvpA family protein [Niabella sp.]|nr:CvpA family protein [Niabella sp.]